ncbi:hypothetical protein [Allopontixanthobacter sediminis]|uniref:Uncharacterized protein n=1 Tax=Allopontixanthobacter sediminis TaxID=1689985 RepID=A0A845B0X5_9SPHN|nr:hypothetical protein [Allopontixanthobacter sediminis]MXP43067.1 hypothetical protein [Allopontixanthobacter sediminis]
MKFNVLSIIRDHFRTLYDARSKSLSIIDILIFYLLPVVLGLCAFSNGIKLNDNAYNVAIILFGIFVALLLNIQVAIFSVLHTKWHRPSDPKLTAKFDQDQIDKNSILRELNTNLSYMILLCSFVLFIAAFAYIFDSFEYIISAFLVFAFTHFVLSLLMVIKRAHALFQKEYTV